jgi:Holliday junction resolvase RusA-like endonuclease
MSQSAQVPNQGNPEGHQSRQFTTRCRPEGHQWASDRCIFCGLPKSSLMLTFSIPLLPPSVNHYVSHGTKTDRRSGARTAIHKKTPEAKAWERDFPLFSRGQFITSQNGRFAVTLIFTPGPKDSGDIDNRNKCTLDCIAKAGMLRNGKGEEMSDAWIKRLLVEIRDSQEDRERGPKTEITIEALG